MKPSIRLVLSLLALAAVPAATAAPLRADHPIIGTWQLTLPDGGCRELYRMHPDGSSLVTSAQEVAESSFEIADQPDPQGYYKQVDTIVKDNGKRDCSGEVTQAGHVSTTYLLFHPGGNMFLSCLDREGKRCIGPFLRLRGAET